MAWILVSFATPRAVPPRKKVPPFWAVSSSTKEGFSNLTEFEDEGDLDLGGAREEKGDVCRTQTKLCDTAALWWTHAVTAQGSREYHPCRHPSVSSSCFLWIFPQSRERTLLEAFTMHQVAQA